jgi:Protein of unknown function (DUF3592)
MANFLIDAISTRLRRRNREKKRSLAAQWPHAPAEINHWQVLQADSEFSTIGAPYQIEAGFHFKVNGEYFGGYLRSVALTHHEAEIRAKGNPTITIRYNPTNPDETTVFAEDNESALSFRIISG